MSRRLGALALLAMLVRALVPAGFMLAEAESAHGRYLTVTFCEDHGRTAQVIDLDTGKHVDPGKLPAKSSDKSSGHDKSKAPPCVFAATAHFASPAAFAEFVSFPVEHAVTFHAADDVRPGEGIPAPPPPQTGPPSLI